VRSQIRYPELAKVEPGSTLPQGDYLRMQSFIDCSGHSLHGVKNLATQNSSVNVREGLELGKGRQVSYIAACPPESMCSQHDMEMVVRRVRYGAQ
jgi:hypothetical protein